MLKQVAAVGSACGHPRLSLKLGCKSANPPRPPGCRGGSVETHSRSQHTGRGSQHSVGLRSCKSEGRHGSHALRCSRLEISNIVVTFHTSQSKVDLEQLMAESDSLALIPSGHRARGVCKIHGSNLQQWQRCLCRHAVHRGSTCCHYVCPWPPLRGRLCITGDAFV